MRSRMERRREVGIFGAGGAGGVRVGVAGVHHGADGRLAVGVDADFVGEVNPAAGVGEAIRVGDGPAGFGGAEVGMGRGDALGDLGSEEIGVVGIGGAAEAAHDGGSGVSVGRGEEDAVGGNAGLLGGECLGEVAELAVHHAGVDDADGDGLVAVAENEAAGVEGLLDGVGEALGEAAVLDDGELQGIDVDGGGAGVEAGIGGGLGG